MCRSGDPRSSRISCRGGEREFSLLPIQRRTVAFARYPRPRHRAGDLSRAGVRKATVKTVPGDGRRQPDDKGASDMDIRNSANPEDIKRHYGTDALRKEFLIEGLFAPDEIPMVYSHVDRMITASAYPVSRQLALECGPELGVDLFLQRREMAVLNIGGSGTVRAGTSSFGTVRR